MENKYTGFLKGRMEIYENRDKCPPDGDVPVLQFINTLAHHGTERQKEYLKNFDNFLDWAYDAEVIGEGAHHSLCFESYCYYGEAQNVFERVLAFREVLRDLVDCLMDGIAPYPEHVANFNMYYEEVKPHRSLSMNGYGMQDIWVGTDEQIAFPLWQLVQLSAEFLSSTPGQYIKRCPCGNLFADRSKNAKRRWCNAGVCGGRHWSGEYYRRKKVLGISPVIFCDSTD